MTLGFRGNYGIASLAYATKSLCMPLFILSLLSFCIETLGRFWRQYPALLYGISYLLGLYCAWFWNCALLLPIALIWFPLLFPSTSVDRLKSRLFLAAIFLLCAFAYAKIHYQFPHIPAQEAIEGTVHIEIASISSSRTFFAQTWLYKGTIINFIPSGSSEPIAKNIPFRLSIPQKDVLRPLGNKSYVINARLKESTPGNFTLAVKKKDPWKVLEGPSSMAEWRFNTKMAFSQYIQEHIQGKSAANFLIGIATGDFDDRQLMYEFSRFGVQHIMAISGFHFSIIAAFLGVCFCFVLSKKNGSLVMAFLLSGYFLFLGTGPSIIRAWLTVMIVLMGQIFRRQGSGLNSLGLSLLIVLIIDPNMIKNLGFQFSFLTTAAILLFYNLMDECLKKVWKKRRLGYVVDMSFFDQHGYVLLSWLRQGIAMTLAVHILALPLMLFVFQKVPWMSLVYNLFFPFMVSLSLLLLLVSLPVALIFPPIADILHSINSVYTNFMLNYTFNMPAAFDFYIRINSVSVSFLIFYISCTCFGVILLNRKIQLRRESFQDFAFL